MAENLTALPFVDPVCRGGISGRLERMFGSARVELSGRRDASLTIKASSIDDWWFSWFEGHGKTMISTDRETLQLCNHALLLLPIRGEYGSLEHPSLLPPLGQLLLSEWPAADAVLSNGDFCYLCAYVPRPFLHSIATRDLPYGRVIDTAHGSGAMVGAALTALVREAVAGNQAANLSAVLPDFLRMALSSFAETEPPHDEHAGLSRRFARIVRYMSGNFTDPGLNPVAVSRACGISVRQFYREFEKHADSFEACLRDLRLQKARAWLKSRPHDSISRIAYDAGFKSPVVFGRSFKRAYDQTPSAFRAAP